MNQFTENPIETLAEWNHVLGSEPYDFDHVSYCCCKMLECPAPEIVCQSITGMASPYGDTNPDDETPTYYSKVKTGVTYSYSETTHATHPAGGTYVSYSGSGSGFEGDTWEVESSDGGPVNAQVTIVNCYGNEFTAKTYCDAGGGWESASYEAWVLGDGEGNITSSGTDITSQTTVAHTNVSGTDDGDGGVFPECTFKTETETDTWDNCHSSTPGYCAGYPIKETTTSTVYGDSLEGWPAGTVTTPSKTYENGVTWKPWLAAVKGFILGRMDFEDEDLDEGCIQESGLRSSGLHESEEDFYAQNAALIFNKVRLRWKIPSIYNPLGNSTDPFPGTYFKISWDIGFFPVDYVWNDPESPQPELVSSETWEWEGPGDHDDPEGDTWLSDWYDVPIPDRSGENRIVNVRYECYKGPFGSKPQVLGAAFDWTDPEETAAEGDIGATGTPGDAGRTGLTTGTLRTGGLRTGGLRTGGLNTGSLRTGGLTSTGLRTGGLRTGGLRTGGLRTGSL
jgi:hypothetical protein